MAPETSVFRNSVARRLFGAFVLASLVPAVATSSIAYFAVKDQLLEKSYDQLQDVSKNYALSVYQRLQLARDLLIKFGQSDEKTTLTLDGSYFIQMTASDRESADPLTVSSSTGSSDVYLDVRLVDGDPSVWLTSSDPNSGHISGRMR